MRKGDRRGSRIWDRGGQGKGMKEVEGISKKNGGDRKKVEEARKGMGRRGREKKNERRKQQQR